MGGKFRANPGSSSGSYIVYPYSGSPKSFGYLKSARKWAKEQANATRGSSIIYKPKGGAVHVKPSKNPSALGSGKRFEQCVERVSARGGARSARAVCASAGIRKYGVKKMESMARAGKKRAAANPRISVKKIGDYWYMIWTSRGGSGSAKASSKREAQQFARELRASYKAAKKNRRKR